MAQSVRSRCASRHALRALPTSGGLPMTDPHRVPRRALEELLAADPGEVIARGRRRFDELAAPFQDRLVLFGAGALGRRTLDGLRDAGVRPLAFADNNRALWGERVSGVTVLPPEEAARGFGGSAAVV